MKPKELRNERLAETLIKNLKRRHIEGFYCATGDDAVKKVSELIADGSSVTWGGTMTVRDLGIPDALRSRGTLEVLDRDLVETPEEKLGLTEKIPYLNELGITAVVLMPCYEHEEIMEEDPRAGWRPEDLREMLSGSALPPSALYFLGSCWTLLMMLRSIR